MCYLLQCCWPVRSHKLHCYCQCYWLTSEHYCWRHHTLWVIENGKINLILTWEPRPYWLVCTLLGGGTYSARGKQLASVVPSWKLLGLRMTGLARRGHWHTVARRMGVTNPFVIGFEACSTGENSYLARLWGRTCDLSGHRPWRRSHCHSALLTQY